MNLMKCPNGHHYDASRFSSCPFCGMEGVNVGPDQTTVPLDVPVSQPGPSVATEPLSTAIPDDDDRTLPVTADMLDGATEKSAPVVGWLVCTEGVNKGTDYRLHQGRNFVGRSSEMDVCILGDNTVSRSSHAIVVYDPRSNVYLAQPGSSKELFYVNDKLTVVCAAVFRDVFGLPFLFHGLVGEGCQHSVRKGWKTYGGRRKNDAVQCPDIRRVQICVACGDRGSHL